MPDFGHHAVTLRLVRGYPRARLWVNMYRPFHQVGGYPKSMCRVLLCRLYQIYGAFLLGASDYTPCLWAHQTTLRVAGCIVSRGSRCPETRSVVWVCQAQLWAPLCVPGCLVPHKMPKETERSTAPSLTSKHDHQACPPSMTTKHDRAVRH